MSDDTAPQPPHQSAGSAEPRQPAGGAEPQPAGSAEPQPAGSAEPQPAGSTEPQPAGNTEPQPAGSAEPRQHGMRQTFGTLFLDAGLSVVTYLGLHWLGVSDYLALLAATVVAALRALYVIVRRREVDAFSIFMLFVFAVGLALSLITGSARFLLIKESFGTAATGIAFLITCLFGRPLMYYAAQRVSAPTAQERERWRGLWQTSAGFRRLFTVMSVVWGTAFLIEALLRLALVFLLPVPVMAAVSPLLTPVLIVVLMVWTFRYSGRYRQRVGATSGTASEGSAPASSN